jgi:hypothetical protein
MPEGRHIGLPLQTGEWNSDYHKLKVVVGFC